MILDQVLQATASRVAGLPGADDIPPARGKGEYSLSTAIGRKGCGNRIISEIKFASPSHGTIRPPSDPLSFAREFARAGAAALSVITEPVFFQGDPATIPAVRPHVEIPLLRKDFIIDERQLAESRALGADAVLLIAGVLGDRLGDMVSLASSYHLEPFVEVHSSREVRNALSSGTRIAGINNRDLRTFAIDLTTTFRLSPLLRDAGLSVVSESGFVWPCDVRALRPYADAFLIGTAIMGSPRPLRRLEGFICA